MPLMIEMEFVKALDRQGRLVLPKEWRERYAKRGLVLVRVEGLGSSWSLSNCLT